MAQRRAITTIFTGSFRRVFIDTSAWIALMNRRDRHHEQSADFFRSLGPSIRWITTWGIVAETYTWLRYHVSYRAGEHWLQEEAVLRDERRLEVIFPTASSEAGTRRNLSRFADQNLSYVDALSLYVVQSDRSIDAAFAFDHHLALTGLAVLPGTTGC
jgi:predicted nucleic acid-binding protein